MAPRTSPAARAAIAGSLTLAASTAPRKSGRHLAFAMVIVDQQL